jgi:hypothetical protein
MLQHPAIILLVGGLILITCAVKRRHLCRRRRQQDWTSLAMESELGHVKDESFGDALLDLPPPLRSVVNSGSYIAGPESLPPSWRQVMTPTSRNGICAEATQPWNREAETGGAEITSDETIYFPRKEGSDQERPTIWRRRTLVFEVPPAPRLDTDNMIEICETPNLVQLQDPIRGIETPPIDIE